MCVARAHSTLDMSKNNRNRVIHRGAAHSGVVHTKKLFPTPQQAGFSRAERASPQSTRGAHPIDRTFHHRCHRLRSKAASTAAQSQLRATNRQPPTHPSRRGHVQHPPAGPMRRRRQPGRAPAAATRARESMDSRAGRAIHSSGRRRRRRRPRLMHGWTTSRWQCRAMRCCRLRWRMGRAKVHPPNRSSSSSSSKSGRLAAACGTTRPSPRPLVRLSSRPRTTCCSARPPS